MKNKIILDNNLEIILVDNKNLQILLNLTQAYEAEFSAITNKTPDANGIFKLDTMPDNGHIGYILYKEKTPIGFTVLKISKTLNDIAEFYIIPSMRLKNGHAICPCYI